MKRVHSELFQILILGADNTLVLAGLLVQHLVYVKITTGPDRLQTVVDAGFGPTRDRRTGPRRTFQLNFAADGDLDGFGRTGIVFFDQFFAHRFEFV